MPRNWDNERQRKVHDLESKLAAERAAHSQTQALMGAAVEGKAVAERHVVAVCSERDELRSQLAETIQAAEKLAERLESALFQLPPDYCHTEGYVECRAALAQWEKCKEGR